MMIRENTPANGAGFCPPRARTLGHERRTVLMAELIASLALALSTLTVVAAVAHAYC
jgi:hypothetical protein